MLKVPYNYFGQGVNYNLPDNPSVIREFEQKFKEWEEKHPDDPTGEIAYNEYILKIKEKQNEPAPPSPPPIEEKKEVEPTSLVSVRLKLELPEQAVKKLKNYAKMRSMRPRDILVEWIATHCQC